jgi:hypothetical protein
MTWKPARFRSRGLAGIGAVLLPSTLALSLTGCALPPAISIASLAVDAVSYMITEKTVTDHALSQLAQQDCALLRTLSGDPVCIDADMTGIAVASGEDQPAEDPYQHLAHADDAEEDVEEVMLASTHVQAMGDGDITLLSTASGSEGTEVRDLGSLNPAPRITGPVGSDATRWEIPPTASEPVTLQVPDIGSWLNDTDLAELDDGNFFSSLSRSRPFTDTGDRPRVRPKATGTGGTETFAALSRSRPLGKDVKGAANIRHQARRAWVRGPAPSAGLYYVIAQSSRWTTTEDMVRRFKDLAPTVISDRLDARAIFRVVVGPFARDQKRSMHRRIRRAGVQGADIIHVDPDAWFGLRSAAFVQISETMVTLGR